MKLAERARSTHSPRSARATSPPRAQARGRASRRTWAWSALAVAAVLLEGIGPALATAGATFVASQETIVLGSSDGLNRTQAEDGIVETLREADVALDPIVLPVTESVTVGSRVSGNFSADLAASDNVRLVYRETPAPPASTETNGATLNATACGWAPCAAGMASDNVSASSSGNLDAATYHGLGFSLPPDAAIVRVEVGVEAYEPSGNDRIGVSISWDGATTFCPSVTVNAPGTDQNVYAFANLTACAGHTWSATDFAADNIATRVTHLQVGGTAETIELDANAVRVTYETNLGLEVRYAWSAIPVASAYVLTIEGAITDENVTVEVLTPPATWNARLSFTSAFDASLSYNLTSSEYNAGSPSVRLVDGLGPDDTASEFRADLVQVTASTLAYRLDVRHDITGVAGLALALTLKGDAMGGDNFNVEVWNFSSSAWDLRAPAAFTSTTAFMNLTLRAEEVGGGAVRVRYTDADPSNAVPGALHLDLVAVLASPSPASPDLLVLGGAVAAAALSTVLLVLLWRRRVRPQEGPSEARGPPLPAETAPGGTAVLSGPNATAGALKSGRSYVVEEEMPERSLKLLEDLTRMGRSGLFLTGRDPRTAVEGYKLRRTRSLRLAEPEAAPSGDTLAPSLETLFGTIQEFLSTNPVGVVLIEGADFLTERNRPRAVSRFLRQVADLVSRGQQIFLVSVSPSILRTGGLRAIEKAMDVVRPT